MPGDTTPIDFSGLIREGDLVVCGQATAEPVTLTEALVAQAEYLPRFRMMVGPLFSDTFSAARAPNVSFLSYGVIGNARRLAKAGRLDVIRAATAPSAPTSPRVATGQMSFWCNLPNPAMVG